MSKKADVRFVVRASEMHLAMRKASRATRRLELSMARSPVRRLFLRWRIWRLR